jgi:hypothetical protein
MTLAAAAIVSTVGDSSPVSAQTAPAPYACAIDSVVAPPGTIFASQVTGSATAPASVDIGQTAELSDVAVAVQFDPADLAFVLDTLGSASLGPNGSADLGSAAIGEDGLASYTGSGTVVGAGGSAMDVTLDEVVVVLPIEGGDPILTATCTPTGDAVTLASIELTGEAPPTTAPPTTGPPTTRPTTPTTPTSQPSGPTPTTLPEAPPAAGSAGTGQPRFTG